MTRGARAAAAAAAPPLRPAAGPPCRMRRVTITACLLQGSQGSGKVRIGGGAPTPSLHARRGRPGRRSSHLEGFQHHHVSAARRGAAQRKFGGACRRSGAGGASQGAARNLEWGGTFNRCADRDWEAGQAGRRVCSGAAFSKEPPRVQQGSVQVCTELGACKAAPCSRFAPRTGQRVHAGLCGFRTASRPIDRPSAPQSMTSRIHTRASGLLAAAGVLGLLYWAVSRLRQRSQKLQGERCSVMPAEHGRCSPLCTPAQSSACRVEQQCLTVPATAFAPADSKPLCSSALQSHSCA